MKPPPKLGRAGLLHSGPFCSWRAEQAALRCRAEHGIDTRAHVETREKLQRKGKRFFSVGRNDFVSKGSALQSLPARPLITFSTDSPKLTAVTHCPPARPTGEEQGHQEKGAARGAQHIPATSVTGNKPQRSQGDGNVPAAASLRPLQGGTKHSSPPTAAPIAPVAAAGTLNRARAGERGELPVGSWAAPSTGGGGDARC